MKKPIEECSADELRNFLTINLGVEVNKRWQKNVMISKIRDAGYVDDEITIVETHVHTSQMINPMNHIINEVAHGADEDAMQDVAAPQKYDPRNLVTPPGKRWYQRILIALSEEKGGQDDVTVGVNGILAQIRRGMPVDVPVEYVEALSRAVKLVYPESDNGLETPRHVALYPYQVLSEPFLGDRAETAMAS